MCRRRAVALRSSAPEPASIRRSRNEGSAAGEQTTSVRCRVSGSHQAPAARVAVGGLRGGAGREGLVILGACQAGHVAARCAAMDRADGLVLAGIVNFDEHFRETYRGVLPGMPRLSEIPTADVFASLAPYRGSLLLIHGGADPYMPHQRLLELAASLDEALAPEAA